LPSACDLADTAQQDRPNSCQRRLQHSAEQLFSL
jgi:hypothetical protein